MRDCPRSESVVDPILEYAALRQSGNGQFCHVVKNLAGAERRREPLARGGENPGAARISCEQSRPLTTA